MELGAGLFYGYVVVDLPLLVSNLCGCPQNEWAEQPPEVKKDAADVIKRLIDAAATVSPGAKLGATAPYARAGLVLLETGASQPRTLANAYLEAVRMDGDPLQRAVDAMGAHLTALDDMYGCSERRFVAAIKSTDGLPSAEKAPLADAAQEAVKTVFGDL
jgi:CRISPR system Cascade subunit CasC